MLRAVSDTLAKGQYPGTTTNDNAAPGNIGEYKSASQGTGVPQTGTGVNITSLVLTAGDWDVTGYIRWSGSSGVACLFQASLSGTNNTIEVSEFGFFATFLNGPGGGNITANMGAMRWSLSAGTTIYLVAMATAAGDITAVGALRARRVR